MSISKGLAFGASAHAIGTAKDIEIGEVEGAMRGLAIAVYGIFTVIFVSAFAHLIYASNESKSVLTRDLGDSCDNLRNSRSRFLIV